MTEQRRRTTVHAARVVAEVVASTVLATGLLLLAGPAASAHDSLVSVVPGDGSTVTAAPREVKLVFSEAVQQLGTGVVVRGADGSEVGEGATHVDGSTVTQALLPLSADGTYYVSYRVVSADGHPVTGTTTFVVQGLGPTMTPVASLADGVRAEGAGVSSPALWTVVGAVLVVLAVATAVGVRRRTRS